MKAPPDEGATEMGPQHRSAGINVFSIHRFNIEQQFAGKPYFEFRRILEEEFLALPQGSRIELLVGKMKPLREYVEWLPAHLIYCITGPDWRNNAEWVRLIQGGDE
ncbi:hypothetical protein AB0O38_09040 [Pseudarthrobacter oxydans]|uniref:hypothetical protein n=1 Tax=Pseudarthrobacter oxydans TaxID=1671 RepID=UPI00343BC375